MNHESYFLELQEHQMKQEVSNELSVWVLKFLPKLSKLSPRFTGHKSYHSGNIILLNYHVTSRWLRDQRVIWLSG